MEEENSKNTFEEGIGSTNPPKEAPIDDVQDGSKVDEETNCSKDEILQPKPLGASVDMTQNFVTDQVFESREAVLSWCQEVGKKCNTVLVISKSQKNITGKGSILEIGCERGGVYRDHKSKDHKPKSTIKRKRETGTKKCGCPFKVKGVWMGDNKWTVRVKDGHHNHEIAKTLTGHAYVARLKKDETKMVIDLTTSGMKPRDILTNIKTKNPQNHSTMRTLYNARQKYRLHEREGRSAMQQLMKLLTEHHYVEWHRLKEGSDEVSDLLWAHPDCISLAQCFPTLLIVDCTYKTNRWKLPLFHMVSVTSTGKTFTIAFSFMQKEVRSNYIWALTHLKTLYDPDRLPTVVVTDRDLALRSAIPEVFPEASMLLCNWHISKNVQSNCRSAFEDNEPLWNKFYNGWDNICKAETLIEYEDAYADFVRTWATKYPDLVKYLRDTWLIYKEHFVKAWTDKVKHYNNTTTNRCESQHGRVKNYVGSSRGNFITFWESTNNFFKNQLVEIKNSFEHDLTSVKHNHQTPPLKELMNHVSHMTLDLIVEELDRRMDFGFDIRKCGCILRTSLGLPCAHELVQYMHDCVPIPLTAIDMQWRQLSIVPRQECLGVFEDQPEVQFLRKRWIEASEDERRSILFKIMEWGMPKTTNMQEPSEPIHGKGRPSNLTKKQKEFAESTKRNPSRFEFEEAKLSQVHTSKTKKKSRSKVLRKKITRETKKSQVHTWNEKVESLPTQNQKSDTVGCDMPDRGTGWDYLENFPQEIHAYIDRIDDVLTDGNCGFRVFAEQLGFDKNNGWRRVREDMLSHLLSNEELYVGMWETDEVNKIKKEYECPSGPITVENWMMMPEAGYIGASTFNVVIILWSKEASSTFFPLIDPPTIVEQHRVVNIVYVNNNHFASAKLKENCPVPPEANQWERNCTMVAKPWIVPYLARMSDYRVLMNFKTEHVYIG